MSWLAPCQARACLLVSLLFSRRKRTHSKDAHLLFPCPTFPWRQKARTGHGKGVRGEVETVHKPYCTPWWMSFQLTPEGASCFFPVTHGHHGPSRRGVTPLAFSFSLGSLNAHIGDTGAFQTRRRSIGDKAQTSHFL